MKYLFSPRSIQAIKSSNVKVLNALLDNSPQLETTNKELVLDIINELTDVIELFAIDDNDVDNLTGCIQPLISLLPPCSVVLPKAAKNCLLVAFWGSKDKPQLIDTLITKSKATVDSFDQPAIDCLREAMRIAYMKDEFNLPGKSSIIVPHALDHIINAIKTA